MKEEYNTPALYEGVENHLLSLFYSGVYITNSEIIEIGRSIGLNLPMKERSALLKQILRHAHESGETSKILESFIYLLNRRIEDYKKLAQSFPEASVLIKEWIHKADSIILLMKREMRGNIYE